MNDGELLALMGTNAEKWAEEFMLRFNENRKQDIGVPGIVTEDNMHGWFANAIEAGRSVGRQELCPHTGIISLADDLGACRLCGKLFEYEAGGPVVPPGKG